MRFAVARSRSPAAGGLRPGRFSNVIFLQGIVSRTFARWARLPSFAAIISSGGIAQNARPRFEELLEDCIAWTKGKLKPGGWGVARVENPTGSKIKSVPRSF